MIRGNFVGSPKLNLNFSNYRHRFSFHGVGTTGAAMLLIRPVIRGTIYGEKIELM